MSGLESFIKGYQPPKDMTKEEQQYLLDHHKVTKGDLADNSWEKMQQRAKDAGEEFGSPAADAKIQARKDENANTPSLLGRLSRSLSRSRSPPPSSIATSKTIPPIVPPSQAPATTPSQTPPSAASQTPPPSAASQTPLPGAPPTPPSQTPALDASAASQEPTGANLRERLKNFRDTTLPKVKDMIKGDKAVKVTTTPQNDGLGGFDSFNKPREDTQSHDDAQVKEEIEMERKKTNDKIQKINDESLKKYAELSKEYKVAAETYKNNETHANKIALEKISAAIDVVYAKTTSELAEIQQEIDEGSVPIPIEVVKTLFNFVLNKIKIAINRRQLQNNALEIGETTMSALEIESKKIETNIGKGGEINISNLAALVDLAKKIADTNAPVTLPDAGVDPAAAAGLSPDDAAKAAAAAGLSPEAAAAAGTLPPGTLPPGTLPPGTPGTTPANPAKALENAPTLEPAPVVNDEPAAVAAVAAVAAGGGQSGGGISRKRSDPKYISQISDNRSKIFKKELEIINSIRRFHRSHTIRKRDKINSILGLRKSRNSKSSVNSKNTRRHVHRNNNHNHKHKHKSTKHIKK